MDMTIDKRPCNGRAHNKGEHCFLCEDTGMREVATVDLGPYMRSTSNFASAFLAHRNWVLCGIGSHADWK